DIPLLDAIWQKVPRAIPYIAENENLPAELQRYLLELIATFDRRYQDDVLFFSYLADTYETLARRGVLFDGRHVEQLLHLIDSHLLPQLDSDDDLCCCAFGVLVRHVCVTGDENLAIRLIGLSRKAEEPSSPRRVASLIARDTMRGQTKRD